MNTFFFFLLGLEAPNQEEYLQSFQTPLPAVTEDLQRPSPLPSDDSLYHSQEEPPFTLPDTFPSNMAAGSLGDQSFSWASQEWHSWDDTTWMGTQAGPQIHGTARAPLTGKNRRVEGAPLIRRYILLHDIVYDFAFQFRTILCSVHI